MKWNCALELNPKPQTLKLQADPALRFLENATVRGLDWYKLLDAPVLTLDVTQIPRAALVAALAALCRYLRLIDSCITQLKAQGPSRTCNQSKEEGSSETHAGAYGRHILRCLGGSLVPRSFLGTVRVRVRVLKACRGVPRS